VCARARAYLRYAYHVFSGVVVCIVESADSLFLEVLSRGVYTCANL